MHNKNAIKHVIMIIILYLMYIIGGDSVCSSSTDGLDMCTNCLSQESPTKHDHTPLRHKVRGLCISCASFKPICIKC